MDSILKASGSVFAQRCHSRHSGVSRSRGQVVQLRKLLFSTSSSFLPPTPASCRSHGRQIKKERKQSKGRKFPRGLFASPQSSVSDNDSGSHLGAILIEMEAVLRVSSAELTAHFASRSRKFRSASSEIGFCLSTLAIPPIPPPREGRRRGEASSPVRREGKQLWASERASGGIALVVEEPRNAEVGSLEWTPAENLNRNCEGNLLPPSPLAESIASRPVVWAADELRASPSDKRRVRSCVWLRIAACERR